MWLSSSQVPLSLSSFIHFRWCCSVQAYKTIADAALQTRFAVTSASLAAVIPANANELLWAAARCNEQQRQLIEAGRRRIDTADAAQGQAMSAAIASIKSR